MPRTRSRPKTEEKFQNALLTLIARQGCGDLGINAVAQEAGADKVLIYRYFGDFNGLLQTVAESRQWLPTADEVIQALPTGEFDALSTLRNIEEILLHHIRGDASTHQFARWRRAAICPICKKYSEEWRALWKQLPLRLTVELSHEQHELWAHSCSLLALIIEAELCDEAVSRNCLEQVTRDLEAINLRSGTQDITAVEESLPTNLL